MKRDVAPTGEPWNCSVGRTHRVRDRSIGRRRNSGLDIRFCDPPSGTWRSQYLLGHSAPLKPAQEAQRVSRAGLCCCVGRFSSVGACIARRSTYATCRAQPSFVLPGSGPFPASLLRHDPISRYRAWASHVEMSVRLRTPLSRSHASARSAGPPHLTGRGLRCCQAGNTPPEQGRWRGCP
jgi:hypothetical protein